MRAAAFALLLTLALSGCALFDTTTRTSTTTTASGSAFATSTPTTPSPSVAQGPSLRDLAILPTDIALGDATAAKVTVVNPGSANFSARVELLLDAATVITVAGNVRPNATLELGGRVQPSSAGAHTVGARLANSTLAALTATLHVRGPRLANATVAPAAEQGCNRVTYNVAFTNVGEGPARDVRVTARLLNENNATIDAQTKSIGTVEAGQKGATQFTVDAPSRCPTTVTYRVAVTIEMAAGSGDALQYTSPAFQA